MAAAPIDRVPGDDVVAAIHGVRLDESVNPPRLRPYRGLFWWQGEAPLFDHGDEFERVQMGYANDVFAFDTGDLDQDGDTDVVALFNTDISRNWDGTAHLRVEINDGEGEFFDSGSYILEDLPDMDWMAFSQARVLVEDLDSDGWLDIILHAGPTGTGGAEDIRVYYNSTGSPDEYQQWIGREYPRLSFANRLPGADPDRDGIINRTKFEDGTDPTDARAVFPRLHIDPGAGLVQARPDKPKYSRGEQVVLTAEPPPGHRFHGWVGDVVSRDAPLTVSLHRSLRLTALFSPDVDFNDVVESSGITWSTGGDNIWAPTQSKAVTGGDSLKAGPISHNEETWVEAMVYGAGTLSFSWWVSSEFVPDGTADCGYYYVDGERKSGLCGPNVQWFRNSVVLEGAGEHTVRWQYIRDHSGSGGQNTMWLDAVDWEPDGPPELPPSYAVWASSRGMESDARFSLGDSDGNGVADLLDYALLLPEKNPAEGVMQIEPKPGARPVAVLNLPPGSRPDLVLTLQSSRSLRTASWRTEAVKVGDEPWDAVYQSPKSTPLTGGGTRVEFSTAPGRFFRLRVALR